MQLINRAKFNWVESFGGKNVPDQVYLFNKVVLDIFYNFFPKKVIIYNDRDPTWLIMKFGKF